MTSKERVRMAVRHREADRVPLFATYTPETALVLRKATGVHEGDIGAAMGNDMVKDCVGLESSYYMNEDPTYRCPWGITWRNVFNETGHYTEIIDFPLAGDEDRLARYEIPDPTEERLYDPVRRLLDRYGADHWIVGSCQCSIFEAAWYLRGLDQLLMDLALNPEYVDALMDKVMEFPRRAIAKYIDLGVDMVWLGDDVATQIGMMISPEMWRRFLKPRYARLFAEFKARRPDIVIAYHSCGNCEAIIPELIEIGLDVLNPIQPMALEPLLAKAAFGDRLTLFGAMDVQRVMPFGSPDEVRAEVRRLVDGCAAGGGFVLAGAHHFQSDTDPANIFAFYEAGKKYGNYDEISRRRAAIFAQGGIS
jgi:uroporphyrinogen decarboxylase